MKDRMRKSCCMVVAVGMAGCAATSPPLKERDASSIEYQLPASAAQVTLNLKVADCAASVKAEGSASIAAVVRPSPFDEHRFRIAGSDLASFTKKREIKLELYPNGAIKTINSSVSDRTAAILGNVLKLATTALAFDFQKQAVGDIACNAKTNKGLSDYRTIERQVGALQARLATGAEADPDKVRKKIDALAAEMARIQTDSLSVSLVRTIDFMTNSKGGVIAWKGAELKKWFDVNGGTDVKAFALGYCVQRESEGELTCGGDLATGFAKIDPDKKPAAIDCRRNGKKCPTTIVFREPVNAVLGLVPMNDDLGIPKDSPVAKLTFPMAQWGTVSYFAFDVGFASSKSLSLSLDEFGRRTSFGWISGAQGEDATAGLVGVAEAASTFATTRAGADLKAKKAEVDALETQQKLNKLKLCEAVLDAGGFVCPEQ